jgi:hypothetical protein
VHRVRLPLAALLLLGCGRSGLDSSAISTDTGLPVETPEASTETPDAADETGQPEGGGDHACILFSGTNANDTWAWDGVHWTQLSPPSSPALRFDASAAALGTSLVLFGGWAQEGNVTEDVAETWIWNGITWSEPSVSPAPAARSDAVAATLGGIVVLFGGGVTGTSTDLANDTWTFDGTRWTELAPAHAPSPRDEAVASTLRDRVVLFGGNGTPLGWTMPQVFSDTWEWDGQDWSQLSPPVSPPARRGAILVPFGDVLLLFGGSSATNMELNDTWTWDGSSWTQRFPPTSPSPRSFAAAGSVDGRVVVFGGIAQGGVAGDTWVWDGSTWTQQQLPQPSAREGATMGCY